MQKKKSPTKYILLGLLFVLVISISIISAILYRNASTGEYRSMENPTLPTMEMVYADSYQTVLFGYIHEINPLSIHGNIVPLSSDKSVDLMIHTYGNSVEKLAYQIRSIDNTSYLDGREITNFTRVGDDLSFHLACSDLLESGVEYRLILTLYLPEKSVYYYTRIYHAKTSYAKELLDFAKTFSLATTDASESNFIINHIQPLDTSPVNDYSLTTIHSKYSVFTYGGLPVSRPKDPAIRISELSATQMSVAFSYPIYLTTDGMSRILDVEEFYTVRYRNGRVYLLDYQRKAEEVFNTDTAMRESGRILFGIGTSDKSIITSQNSEYIAFVVNNTLWSYHVKNNSMNRIFTFRDDSDSSGRSAYNHYTVEPIKVARDGTVDFIVYGYMNRGLYEGEVGICFYRYDTSENAATRLFYMPVTESEEPLELDLGSLTYVNEEDVCYLRYGDSIYSISLTSGESVQVTSRAYPGMYAKNRKGNVVAWCEGEDPNYPSRLVILNMDTQSILNLDSEEDEYIKILDFIGNDIVYGFGHKKDSLRIANMDRMQLLNRIYIASTEEELLIKQEYIASEGFVESVNVYDTRVTLRRVRKNSDQTITDLSEEVLLITQTIDNGENRSSPSYRIHNEAKKEYYIKLPSTIHSHTEFSVVDPRFEISKEANRVQLQHIQKEVYYVYAYGHPTAIESTIGDAIRKAYPIFGTVVGANRGILWDRGTRDYVRNIAFQAYRTEDNSGSLGASIRALASQMSLSVGNVSAKLNGNVPPTEILRENNDSFTIIDLNGCTLNEVLYFTGKGNLIMAILGDRKAVLIVGYTMTGVLLYDPDTGITTEKNTAQAEAEFSESETVFISYYTE